MIQERENLMKQEIEGRKAGTVVGEGLIKSACGETALEKNRVHR